MAPRMVAMDLELLKILDAQIDLAEHHLAVMLPSTPFAVLTTVPGVGLPGVRPVADAVRVGQKAS